MKIATATGNDVIFKYLEKRRYEVISDISYQEGVLKLIKKEW